MLRQNLSHSTTFPFLSRIHRSLAMKNNYLHWKYRLKLRDHLQIVKGNVLKCLWLIFANSLSRRIWNYVLKKIYKPPGLRCSAIVYLMMKAIRLRYILLNAFCNLFKTSLKVNFDSSMTPSLQYYQTLNFFDIIE